MNRQDAIVLYHQQLQILSKLRGELAEIEKMELEAKVNGYSTASGGVTDRRVSADFSSLALTQQKIDAKANIEIALDNIFFLRTVINHNLEISEVTSV